MTTSFLLSGSGGQGVITMAILLAQAAALYENRLAVQSQSYGPEARGGATRSDVIISDEPIMFPKVIYPHVLVSLTNQSCGKYLPLIRPNGIFLYDTGLVQPMRNTQAIYVRTVYGKVPPLADVQYLRARRSAETDENRELRCGQGLPEGQVQTCLPRGERSSP